MTINMKKLKSANMKASKIDLSGLLTCSKCKKKDVIRYIKKKLKLCPGCYLHEHILSK